MSVPLPSPSPLSASLSKPIPRRPAPISLEENGGRSPSNGPGGGGAWTSGSPNTRVAPGESWRDRVKLKSAGASTTTASTTGAVSSPTSAGPERTVGGFEKRKEPSGISSSPVKDKLDANGDSKTAALAHVPCRFFKAGACTAGASCPFSHEEGGKKEVCQWFLKGNCRFGHKCALAHVRPGEPLSMDRKNKKEQQRMARGEPGPDGSKGLLPGEQGSGIRDDPPITQNESYAAPVPIKSALSSSLHQQPQNPRESRSGSHLGGTSPMREPYGPPSAMIGSPSAGFLGRSPGNFAASPSRPSPLSASFTARSAIPGPLSLKSPPTTSIHSPLRPPNTSAAPGIFSSSFSHSALSLDRDRSGPGPAPMSASFADSTMRRSIWARSEKVEEQLSPRKSVPAQYQQPIDVFDDEEDHGEDFLPSSLSDLLTPVERARRLSRRDSSSESPGRGIAPVPGPGPIVNPFNNNYLGGGEPRLAQSAGPTMGPGNFLQSLWSQDGEDIRRNGGSAAQHDAYGNTNGGQRDEFAFGPSTASTQPRQSLLSQRAPISPQNPSGPFPSTSLLSPGAGSTRTQPLHQRLPSTANDPPVPYFSNRQLDPSSPSAKALQEHAPGQSLPGGVATALSRLHLHGPKVLSPSNLGTPSSSNGTGNGIGIGTGTGTDSDSGMTPPSAAVGVGKKEENDDVMFAMDG